MVPKGNPLGIEKVDDLVKTAAHFVNRQKGAGTRILFDLLLNEAGLEAEQINGYRREMFSHLAVAAEVDGDREAAGLGIYPAAKAMGLSFIPVADEEYDLIMTRSFFESDKGKMLRHVILSDSFKQRVANIGGYEVVATDSPKQV